MSNLEPFPQEILCRQVGAVVGVEILPPREVPLGGPRAMPVRRTLPQKKRSLIGSWCFLDHYGPDLVASSGGMKVARHPHTGLATVSWLFTGKIEHLDSAGHAATIRPGEVNLMVAGRGISHQEISTADTTVLHGAQLWFALPDATRHMAPVFEHYTPEPVWLGSAEVRVFLGSLAGSTSPVDTYSPPLLGAEATIRAGGTLELDLDPSFEHGMLLDTGDLLLNGAPLPVDHLAYLPTGQTRVIMQAGVTPVRVLILGGEPLGEQIIMWWNFIGRTHEEVVSYRAAWQSEIGAEPSSQLVDGAYLDGSPFPRFGPFPAGTPAALPAPALPNIQLRPRAAGKPSGVAMEPKNTVTVQHAETHQRYEILDGDTVIGKTEYVPAGAPGDSERIFYHTEVDEAYSGQGLAAVLVKDALDDTIAEGLSVVPVCPYIKSWMLRHPEYQQHAVSVEPAHLKAAAGAPKA